MPANCGLLFVEDDIAVREALLQILVAEHYTVFIASCLGEALAAYNSNRIDLVLLDLKLGQEDGWDVFTALKNLDPDLPVVITSAQPERLLKPSTSSPCGVLEKPFEVSALLALLAAARCSSENALSASGPLATANAVSARRLKSRSLPTRTAWPASAPQG